MHDPRDDDHYFYERAEIKAAVEARTRWHVPAVTVPWLPPKATYDHGRDALAFGGVTLYLKATGEVDGWRWDLVNDGHKIAGPFDHEPSPTAAHAMDLVEESATHAVAEHVIRVRRKGNA